MIRPYGSACLGLHWLVHALSILHVPRTLLEQTDKHFIVPFDLFLCPLSMHAHPIDTCPLGGSAIRRIRISSASIVASFLEDSMWYIGGGQRKGRTTRRKHA